MALLDPIPPVYASGEGKRFAVFRLTGFRSGDSFDVKHELSRVDTASAYAPSSMKAMALAPLIVGTLITITDLQLDNDVVYLSVGGAAA